MVSRMASGAIELASIPLQAFILRQQLMNNAPADEHRQFAPPSFHQLLLVTNR
jgi:hypothetical protein